MSYDIHLFKPILDEDPLVTANRDPEIDSPSTGQAQERNNIVFSALKSCNPSLELFEFEGGIQIVSETDGTGISIELNNNSGAISVPYWHKNEAGKVLGLICEYLNIIHELTGFVAFDPQSETLLNPKEGFSLSIEIYSVGVNALSVVLKKPWWKFW